MSLDYDLTVTYADLGIEWRYDVDANAGYLLLRPITVVDRTVRITDSLNYDLDAEGRVIGVEMIAMGEMPSWLTLARVLKSLVAAPPSGDERPGQ